jgi:hypothetical protein
MSFVALALVGVNVARPPAANQPAAATVGVKAPPATSRNDEPVAPTTRSRALRLLADHWGIALRASARSTVEVKREYAGPKPATGGTAKVTETESHTRDVVREIAPADARLVEDRFRQVGGRVLVVTMPDPTDSALALDFDRYLEAVERAVAARGFVPDRHDLPWKHAGDTDGAAPRTDSVRHRSEPGLLLFRETGKRGVLILAVVGETPIQGIQKLAFENALMLARCLNGLRQEIPIVGPALSGSVPSIRLVLNQKLTGLKPKPRIRFIATTATSDQNQADLTRQDGLLDITYRAAVHPNSVSFEALEAFLAGRGFAGDSMNQRQLAVAILSESSSAYGSSLSTRPADTPTCGPQLSVRTISLPPSSRRLTFAYHCFTFPMQIAQLRAAYEREQLTGPRGRKDATAPTALSLSYSGSSDNRERIPVYATTLSANAAERVLLDTFASIARQRIRHVVINATDIRDRLFVVQLARRWLPDAQLVSFDTDVLLTHPDIAVEAEGLLTVSSYPLTLGATPSSDGAFRSFPSPGAASYFNATSAQLTALLTKTNPKHQVEPVGPFVGLALASGRRGIQPRVWVSVINHMQEWPLASFDPTPGVATFLNEDARYGALASRFVADVGQRSHVLLVGTIAALAIVCLVFFTAFPSRTAAAQPLRTHALIAFRTAPAWLLVLLASALALSIWQPHPQLIALAAAGMTCLAGSAIACASPRGVATCRTFHAGAATLILLVIATAIWPHLSTAREVGLSELRWYVLGSGVDPRLPLTLAAGAIILLLLVQPWQGTDCSHFNGLNPFPQLKPGRRVHLASGFGEFHELISRELFWNRRARFVTGAIVAAVAIGAGAGLNAPYAQLRGFDGTLYDWAAIVLLTGGLFFIVASGLQVWCLWRRVQQLLRRLAWHPLHAAFDRLPDRLAHDLGLKGSVRFAPVSALGFCIEQAGIVANHLDGMAPLRVPNAAVATALLPALTLRQKARSQRWAWKFRREIRQAEAARRSRRAVDSATIARLLEVSRSLSNVLFQFWEARPLVSGVLGTSAHPWPQDAKGLDGGPPHTVHVYRAQVPDEFHVWMRLCEDFVATMTVVYLRFVFVTLKRMLLGVVGATILLLLATVSYPFSPRGSLTLGALLLVLALIGLVLALIFQTERDPLLSRIANTAPNKVTFSSQLVTQFALYVCAPAAIAVTTQFPQLRDSVGRFVDPILKAIQG